MTNIGALRVRDIRRLGLLGFVMVLLVTTSALAQQLRQVVTSQTALALPSTFESPTGGMVSSAGDYMFFSGESTALFRRAAGAAQAVLVSQQGDVVPGIPGSQVDYISSAKMNPAGLVAFSVQYFDGVNREQAILSFDGSAYRVISASGWDAPLSTTPTYDGTMTLIGVNSAGDVAFTSGAQPPGTPVPGASTNTSIYVVPRSGAPARIVGPGDPAGIGIATFYSVSGLAFNDRQEVLFSGYFQTGTATSSGLFVGSPAGVRKVVAVGDPNPQGGTFSSSFAYYSLNNVGDVLFGQYRSTPAPSGYQLFYCPPAGGPPQFKLGPGSPAPATIGGTYQSLNFQQNGLNDSGTFVFGATINGGSTSYALLRYTIGATADSIQTVMRANQVVPGTSGQGLFSGPYNVNFAIGATGEVAFSAGWFQSNVPSASGLFRQTGTAEPTVVATYTTVAPVPGGGTFVSFGTPTITPTGHIYFQSTLNGGTVRYGGFLAPAGGGALSALVSSRDPLPAGARRLLRNATMGAAGNFVAFTSRLAGGATSLWLHNLVSGVNVKVAAEGEAAADGRVVDYIGWGSPAYPNATGTVTFYAELLDAANNYFSGLYAWNATTGLQKLVEDSDRYGSSAYLSLTPFSNTQPSPINDAGQVVFRATVYPSGSGSSRTGLFVVTPGAAPVPITLTGDPGPSGGTFSSFSGSALINQYGQVAFSATTVVVVGSTSTYTQGVFLGTPGSAPVKIVAVGDTFAGGGVFSSVPSTPTDLNDGGQVLFPANLTGGAGAGLFLGTTSAPPVPVALRGTRVASAGGTFYLGSSYTSARLNNAGDVLFADSPRYGPGSGVFLRRGPAGPIGVVAQTGQTAPGTAGLFRGFSTSASTFGGQYLQLGPTGEAVFSATVDIGNGLTGAGLFRSTAPGAVDKLLVVGDTVPAAGAGAAVNADPAAAAGMVADIGYVAAGGAGHYTFRSTFVGGTLSEAIYTTSATPWAPTSLTTSTSGNTITLSWRAATGGPAPTTYVIEAGSSQGSANLANFATNNTALTFVAGGVANGIYYLRVLARNTIGTSAPSNEARMVVGPVAPEAPGGLHAAATGSTLTMTWTAPTTGGTPTSYTIEAGSSSGLANLANFSTGNSAVTFTASGVSDGTYYLRVRATNSAGISVPSNEAVVVIGVPIGAPGNLQIVSNAGGAIALAWDASTGAPTTYVLEAGLAAGLTNAGVFDLGGTATTFSTSGVSAGTYYLRVRAKRGATVGPVSNEVTLVVR